MDTALIFPGIDDEEEESDDEGDTAQQHNEEGWDPYSSKTVSVHVSKTRITYYILTSLNGRCST